MDAKPPPIIIERAEFERLFAKAARSAYLMAASTFAAGFALAAWLFSP